MEVLGVRRWTKPVGKFVLAGLLFQLGGWASAGDTLSRESKVKLAYLYNFTRFVNWPETSFNQTEGDFIIGVFGDDPFGRSLDVLAAKRKAGNRKMRVRRVGSLEEAADCHILYLPEQTTADVAGLSRLRGRPILIVGEHPQLVQVGGVIAFYDDPDGTIGFTINVDAVNRQRLSVAAQVLKLATVVRDTDVDTKQRSN